MTVLGWAVLVAVLSAGAVRSAVHVTRYPKSVQRKARR